MKKLIVICMFTMLALQGCGSKEENRDIKDEVVKNEEPIEQEGSIVEESSSIIKESDIIENTIETGNELESESESIEEDMEGNYINIDMTTNNNNSIKLFDKLYTGDNLMTSPISLNMALAMLASGADGDTEKQLVDYLGTDEYLELYKEYNKIISSMYNEDSEADEYFPYHTAYEITNSIWVDDSIQLKDDYVNSMKDNLSALVESIDFGDKVSAAGKINSWCNEKTHELIPKIVESDSLDQVKTVLLNTLYFESPWVNGELWTKSDVPGSFKGFNEDIENVQYMDCTLDRYYENDSAQAVRIRYANGMEFIGILPKDEGDFDLGDLDINYLIESNPVEGQFDVYTKMPYINFESELKLSDSLKELGMTDMFKGNVLNDEPPYADFSKMSDTESLYVDDIIQKTKIELDEKGTKAAAATAVSMLRTCSLPPFDIQKIHIDFDRPFAYVIYDRYNSQIVFLGKVVDITPEMMIK